MAANLQKKPQGKKESTSRVFELNDCCVFCNNRELIQCIKYNDLENFKRLLKSYETVSNPYQRYSRECYEDIFSAAIENPDESFLKAILDYEHEVNLKRDTNDAIKRVKLPNVSLEKIGTGEANKLQFYFPIRKV